MVVESFPLSSRMYLAGRLPIGLRYEAKAYAARFAVRRRSSLIVSVDLSCLHALQILHQA